MRWSYYDGQLTFAIVNVQDLCVAGHLHRAPVAQGQLTAAAGCAVILAAGVAAEVAGPDPAAVTSVADLAVGAAFAGCGLWLVAAGRSWGWLGLATAAGWFAGTAAGAAPWLPAYLGNVAALGYRAFLLHLLACALGRQPASIYRPLILAGYLAVLLPVPADSLATAALMAGLAALAAVAARRAPADRRRAIAAVCLSAVALAVIWSLAAAGVTGGTGAELANDLALVAAAFVLAAGWARGGWLQGAINALVVELGPSQHPAAPVSALLANALADPELDVRYSVPGLGWFDENGLRVTAPSGEGAGPLTRVATPDGGEVVLVHGPAAAAGPALARAAATAAALAMESARLGAEVRQQADAVRESRRRLLAVADAERQALETRLRAGPVGRLRRVDEALAGIGDQTAHDIRGQVAIALDDLVRLARGLYPGALGTQPFQEGRARPRRGHAHAGAGRHSRPARGPARGASGAGVFLLFRMPHQCGPALPCIQRHGAAARGRRAAADKRARRRPRRRDHGPFARPARAG